MRRPVEITSEQAGPLFGNIRHCCIGRDVPFTSIRKIVCLVGVAREVVDCAIRQYANDKFELFGTSELDAEESAAVARLLELVK